MRIAEEKGVIPMSGKKRNRWEGALLVLVVLFLISSQLFFLIPIALIIIAELLSYRALQAADNPAFKVTAPDQIEEEESFDAAFSVDGIGKGPISGEFRASVANQFTGENVIMPGEFKTRLFGSPKTELSISETRFGWIRVKASEMELSDLFVRKKVNVKAAEPKEIFVSPKLGKTVLPKRITKEENVLVLFDNILPESLFVTPKQKENMANLFFSIINEMLQQGYSPSAAWMADGGLAVIRPVQNESDLLDAEKALAGQGFVTSDTDESSISMFLRSMNIEMYNRFCFVSYGDDRDIESLRAKGGTTVYRVSADPGQAPGKDQEDEE